MRSHRNSSSGSSSSSSSRRGIPCWHREMAQATALSLIALLIVPLSTEAHGVRRLLAAKPPGVKLSADRCHREITGCNTCYEEKAATAAGAQFPGMQGAPEVPSIVTCYRCKPPYLFNAANGNCDCGKGSGSAFANGTLIRVDMFEPPKKEPTTLSDVFPPGSVDSTASSSIKAESGSATATTTTMESSMVPATATTVSFSSVDSSSDSDDAQSPQRQQAALRRRFVNYLRNQGYEIESAKGTLMLRRQAKNQLFSADSSTAAGGLEPQASTEEPQPLICVPCKPATTSIGGMIGGSFCMPQGKN